LWVVTAASLALAAPAFAAPSDQYVGHNIMSSNTTLIPADRQDPLLINPWGLTSSAGSPWWPVNQGSNTSTIVNASGTPNATLARIVKPTGGVAGAGSGNFVVPPGGAANTASSFIFANMGGEIRGWRGGIANNDAILGFTSPGAVYMGLALATFNGSPRLYAADLRQNKVDMVSSTWAKIDGPAGAFVDPDLPAGYAPYGIQAVGNRIIVTYARQPAADPPAGRDYREVPGAGAGVVNAFGLDGKFLSRVASPGGVLNAPWGVAQAATNFGAFAGDLLIGNFGDGRINAFHENADGTWTNSGLLKNTSGAPLSLNGLWALQFGKGNPASGATNHLYYTAGPFGETQGVVGRIMPNPGEVSGTVPATLAVTLGAPAAFGAFVPGVTKDYTAATTANVISSAGDATLSVSDPSSFATGKLVNGTFSLAQPLQVSASSAGGGAAAAQGGVGGSAVPNTLITYSGPISNDTVTINFVQTINSTDPLRTGQYAKTLTFTLSTTAP
jgi:uncharacterized protein (TIGR03118 family)